MGNASTKESRPSGDSVYRSAAAGREQPQHDHNGSAMYGSRAGRGSRHDLSFLGFGSRQDSDSAAEPRKETKQERDARRAERDRVARLKERERSLKEESVDGGYLVTLGTYTGAEDFNKAIVRQLMIERRLAPFWRGLNDHSDSWTEYQLVAAARGMPIPAPDEPPPEDLSAPATPQISNTDDKPQTASIPMQRHAAHSSEGFSNLSASHPAFSTAAAGAPSSPTFPSPSPLFRGRAKTLVSLTSKNSSQAEITPQEIRLPPEPRINGQPVEAFLYKDVGECPICFLYYPPYLNKTRCCDQPICSECFVQVKRPDPHPPEHLDPNTTPPTEARSPEDDINLVSEVATCPFCKTPEFGVSYEAPPLRRGLAYANTGTPMVRQGSAMSSSSSLAGSAGGTATPVPRRRTQSLSANDTSVITTDRIRPEWATKLAQAKAHAARRAASATALHTAAYMMGPPGQGGGLLGRRRRVELRAGEGASTSNLEQLLAVLEAHEQTRAQRPENNGSGIGGVAGSNTGGGLFAGRRGSRTDDLEDLMMMEAIRQSIAAEEDRKKKEEKEAAKQQKKDDKQKAKDQKKAEKAAKKGSVSLPSPSGSSFSIASGSGTATGGEDDGKGKAKAISSSETVTARLAFNPMNEPTSTLNSDVHGAKEDPQRHLEQSRANLDQTHHRQTSSGSSPVVRSRESSLASSVMETSGTSIRNESSLVGGASSEAQPDASSLDPAINFGSLAAIVDKDGEFDGHHAADGEASVTRERGSSGESTHSGPPPHYEENASSTPRNEQSSGVTTAAEGHSRQSLDHKHNDDVALVEHPHGGQTA